MEYTLPPGNPFWGISATPIFAATCGNLCQCKFRGTCDVCGTPQATQNSSEVSQVQTPQSLWRLKPVAPRALSESDLCWACIGAGPALRRAQRPAPSREHRAGRPRRRAARGRRCAEGPGGAPALAACRHLGLAPPHQCGFAAGIAEPAQQHACLSTTELAVWDVSGGRGVGECVLSVFRLCLPPLPPLLKTQAARSAVDKAR